MGQSYPPPTWNMATTAPVMAGVGWLKYSAKECSARVGVMTPLSLGTGKQKYSARVSDDTHKPYRNPEIPKKREIRRDLLIQASITMVTFVFEETSCMYARKDTIHYLYIGKITAESLRQPFHLRFDELPAHQQGATQTVSRLAGRG